MKHTAFGIRNELRAQEQQELAKEAARADAIVVAVMLIIVAAYSLAAYLDQIGAFK